MGVLPDGRVIIAGGCDGAITESRFLSTTESRFLSTRVVHLCPLLNRAASNSKTHDDFDPDRLGTDSFLFE